ncbi:hypothetical protein GEMRC1_007175 [Eukaryota sp. GEM-RC1]
MSDLHFNVNGSTKTLVGNWFEEQCYKDSVPCTPSLMTSTCKSSYKSPTKPCPAPLKQHLESKQLYECAKELSSTSESRTSSEKRRLTSIASSCGNVDQSILFQPPTTRWTELKSSSSIYHSNPNPVSSWGKTVKFSTPIDQL